MYPSGYMCPVSVQQVDLSRWGVSKPGPGTKAKIAFRLFHASYADSVHSHDWRVD